MFTALTTAVALEALWQIYNSGWSSKITTVLDEDGARGRWFKVFEHPIERALEAIR